MKAIWTKNNRRTKKKLKGRNQNKSTMKKKNSDSKKNLRSHQICSFRRVVGRGEGTNE